jgi:four helix bundle protein
MQGYTKLEVWEQAHRLAMDVHRASMCIPRRDNAVFISQLRRAAQSVPTNIAEGSSKESNREFARFLQIAAGSAAELHYHLQFTSGTALIPQQNRGNAPRRHHRGAQAIVRLAPSSAGDDHQIQLTRNNKPLMVICFWLTGLWSTIRRAHP